MNWTKTTLPLDKISANRGASNLPSLRLASLALALFAAQSLPASENVPHRPFAQWADLPEKGQFVAGLVYDESEAYHIYANRNRNNITVEANGEKYGIDINQGFVALQYGITEKWAVDLSVGYTTAAWRTFDPNQSAQSTTGLMDIGFGVRYQIINEAQASSPWLPTLTFRAGAVLPGTYDQNFAFAPGYRSASIEPEFLMRKHFGWTGLGGYADLLYRWNRTTGNDQYMTTVGLFQQIKGWEIAAGYRHMQTISGGDIIYSQDDPTTIVYPRAIREINDGIEAGFSYTTSKRHIRYGFQTLTIFDGSNTDNKFWIGGSIDFPFSFKK